MKTRYEITGLPPCDQVNGNLVICVTCSGVMVLCDGGNNVRPLTRGEQKRELLAGNLKNYILKVGEFRKERGGVH